MSSTYVNTVCLDLWLNLDIRMCFKWCCDPLKQCGTITLHCYNVTPLLLFEYDGLFIPTTMTSTIIVLPAANKNEQKGVHNIIVCIT